MFLLMLFTHTEIFSILMDNDANILTTIQEEQHYGISDSANNSNNEPSSSSFQDFVDEGKNYCEYLNDKLLSEHYSKNMLFKMYF